MPTTPPEIPQTVAPNPNAHIDGKVFLGGLGPDLTEQDLTEYFSPMGVLIDVVVMRDKTTRNGRGFGFVTFQVWPAAAPSSDPLTARRPHWRAHSSPSGVAAPPASPCPRRACTPRARPPALRARRTLLQDKTVAESVVTRRHDIKGKMVAPPHARDAHMAPA